MKGKGEEDREDGRGKMGEEGKGKGEERYEESTFHQNFLDPPLLPDAMTTLYSWH